MDLDRLKQVAVAAGRSMGRVGATLKTNPAAGLLTALAVGFLAGRIFRRPDPTVALAVRAK